MNIAIIGNGVSGITAARTLRKLNAECSITVISSETKYFFSRTALMYVYMGHMKFEHTKPYEDNFWKKNRIELIQDHVTDIDFDQNKLKLEKGGDLSYDHLILATGSKSNKLEWPGIELKGVQGLYSYQDLQMLEENTHAYNLSPEKQRVNKAVIVGGGLIGVELAEMLQTRNIEVTFLVREDRFWGSVLPLEEARMIENHMLEHGVKILHNTELKEILGDEHNRVKAVRTKSGEEINCEFVGLTIGVKPNIEFLKGSKLSIDRGVLVDTSLQTNISNVFAAGDCVQFQVAPEGRKNIEQVWYTGRMMGEIAARNVFGEQEKYNPGPWFNSAKFFDIEYQTYGQVGRELGEGASTFYWENESRNTSFRMVFDKTTNRLLGVNVFGIRLRHEDLDSMLRSSGTADNLLENWKNILFDPEFYVDYGSDIIEKYNAEFNKKIKSKSTSWLSKIL